MTKTKNGTFSFVSKPMYTHLSLSVSYNYNCSKCFVCASVRGKKTTKKNMESKTDIKGDETLHMFVSLNA